MTHTLPLYPYSKYPYDILDIVHSADQWIPLIAMIYTLFLLIFYCHQYVTRYRVWFSPSTIILHRMAILSLSVLFVYATVNYLLSNNYYSNLPSPFNSCSHYIRVLFITFVCVKYSTILCIVLNLAYINQNPFINPRYKYITKHSRLRIKRFFNILCFIIVPLFFVIGIYGAWVHSASDLYTNDTHNTSYCTQTFTVSTFFFSFSGDILGVIAFSCLFGRNACEICRSNVKPNQGHKYNEGNLSDVGHDGSYNVGSKMKYDLDDPIRSKLASENNYLIYSVNKTQNDSQREIRNQSTTLKTANMDSLILNIDSNEDNNGNYTMMNRDRSTNGKEIICDEEWKGIQEQKRVLRLIWIMLFAYWMSVLLFIFLGLLESVSCFCSIISVTCVVLLNDYEFGTTYWKYRTYICCVCTQTYCGVHCFCGDQKVYRDEFHPVSEYNDKNNGLLTGNFVKL